MTTINANGVALGVESFGNDDAPLVLLAGGTTMLSWPDALCERLAAGGRRVVRYDLRDSGESAMADPEAPVYTLRDLAADAAALVDALGDDPVAARAVAERIWDRTPGTAPPVQMANQLRTVFSKLDCNPRWRERLAEIQVPTLVVHGRRDPFFPVGNGQAIANEISGARLLVLEDAATALTGAAAEEVADAMLALG
jgi:pimeloyl-ACP methyl ester carboxylesterase